MLVSLNCGTFCWRRWMSMVGYPSLVWLPLRWSSALFFFFRRVKFVVRHCCPANDPLVRFPIDYCLVWLLSDYLGFIEFWLLLYSLFSNCLSNPNVIFVYWFCWLVVASIATLIAYCQNGLLLVCILMYSKLLVYS